MIPGNVLHLNGVSISSCEVRASVPVIMVYESLNELGLRMNVYALPVERNSE